MRSKKSKSKKRRAKAKSTRKEVKSGKIKKSAARKPPPEVVVPEFEWHQTKTQVELQAAKI